MVPKFDWVKKILIIGSGAIKIGEAGEFDYSGAQAIKALKEEGVGVILVNPNIATIQTDPKFADKTYFLPITPEWVEKIIEKERPNGILLGFGGQTALNCGMELHELGILDKYNVRVLGTNAEPIKIADDRELFRELMMNKKISIPKSEKAQSVEEAIEVADRIGYPVMIRVSYTLGGHGSGIARNMTELVEIASRGLAHSRIKQILVEESLEKWKEIEYEVMRDADDNCTIVCNMENFDPMGIHTGESIVVAPSQTLTNKEYHAMRDTCFKVVRALGILGECNVQFAVNPENSEFRVIEVNSRLSRSSALASKATGYPIAYIAAKMSLGYTLYELTNKVTGITSACFEPSLDYVTVKIPRWDFQKFKNVSRKLGTQMKSVGEVMAIGRNFEEALQKAVRMTDIGIELTDLEEINEEKILSEIANPTDKRIFYITAALELGFDLERISKLSGIDKWFLWKIQNIVDTEKKIKSIGLNRETISEAKKFGFSDKKIASLVGRSASFVRNFRIDNKIIPVVKQIDTLAGEWPATTNYLYTSYEGSSDIEPSASKKVIVLGSGVYRIGSSVEFDWCCVNMAQALKERGFEVIMVNCNPETVSTDYDISDKLYFEELTLERVLDIIDFENPECVVVSVGGQIPNSLALKLKENGVKILGTSAEKIDIAEDREKFSELLDKLNIPQPQWSSLKDIESVKEFSRKIGYPVLVRPSYVLSGSAMKVANSDDELEVYLKSAAEVSREHPVVISKFISGAREVEIDGVSDGENVFIGAIMEHIEDAGVHSGDATISIPTFSISNDIKEVLRNNTRKMARALEIVGPFNVQYLVKENEVMVIECNLRASRSMPFVSKTIGQNLMEIASDAMLRRKIPDSEGTPKYFGIKSPQFSFSRLTGSDPVIGVEMVSTGEVACFGKDFHEAFLKSIEAGGIKLPTDETQILLIGDAENIPLKGMLGSKLISSDSQKISSIEKMIQERKIALALDFSGSSKYYNLRRKCADFSVPVITNILLAKALFDSRDKIDGSIIEFASESPSYL